MASGRVAFCNADSMTSETTCGMPTGGGPGGPPPDSGGPPNSGGLFSNWFGSIGPPPSGGLPGGGPPGNGPPPEGGPPPRGGGGGGPPSGGPPGSGFFSNVLGGGGSSGGGGPPGGNHGDFGLHTVIETCLLFSRLHSYILRIFSRFIIFPPTYGFHPTPLKYFKFTIGLAIHSIPRKTCNQKGQRDNSAGAYGTSGH